MTPLIEVCHRAENVFDKIRNGDVEYDASAADIIMRAFDVISDYIQQLNDGERELESADDGLLSELDALWKGGAAAVAEEPEVEAAAAFRK